MQRQRNSSVGLSLRVTAIQIEEVLMAAVISVKVCLCSCSNVWFLFFYPSVLKSLPSVLVPSVHHRPCPPPSQLHDKFEQLKRMHQEEKRKVEEKRRDLEEEMNAFNRKKVAAETLSLSQPLKKDKDKKK